MRNKNVVAVFLGSLTFLSLCLGLVGLLQSSKASPIKEKEKEYTVIYKYYLDDVEVNEMPVNSVRVSSSSMTSTLETADVEKLYAFNAATCTNNVTYKWDDQKWEFTPSNTADTTCKLYFVSTYNKVGVEATNAKIEKFESDKVERGKDFVVKITPTEGYAYSKTTCTNDEVVEWNKEKSELTIKSIFKKTDCKVEFEINKFDVNIIVNNGSGATKLVEKEYGSKIEASIAAATNYGTPTISCTNNQTGTWTNGIFTIEKLTNKTECTVNFVIQQQASSYTVTLDTGEHGILAQGTETITVKHGNSASFTVQTSEGYELTGVTCTEGGSAVRSGNVIKVSNVTKNITCNATYEISSSNE